MMLKHNRSIKDQIKMGDRPNGDELRRWDVGQVLALGEGFGLVLKQDVGKRCWVRDFGFVMESDEQRDKRKNLTRIPSSW